MRTTENKWKRTTGKGYKLRGNGEESRGRDIDDDLLQRHDVDWRDLGLARKQYRATGDLLTLLPRRVAKVFISWIPPNQSYKTFTKRRFFGVVRSERFGTRIY